MKLYHNNSILILAVSALAFLTTFLDSSRAQGFQKLENFTVQRADEDSKAQHEASGTWQKIILDDELFSLVWPNAETAYAVGLAFKAIGKGNAVDHLSVPLPQVKNSKVTPEALKKKYGDAPTEVSENDGDKGITYHVYGPLAFGIKTGDMYFTFVRAERALYERGFGETAKAASE